MQTTNAINIKQYVTMTTIYLSLHMFIIVYKITSSKNNVLTNEPKRKLINHNFESLSHNAQGFLFPFCIVPWEQLWKKKYNKQIKFIRVGSLIFLCCGYSFYNLIKRCSVNGEWFYNSNFFINQWDYFVGLLFGIITSNLIMYLMNNKFKINSTKPIKSTLCTFNSDFYYNLIVEFILNHGIIVTIGIYAFALYKSIKTKNINNPEYNKQLNYISCTLSCKEKSKNLRKKNRTKHSFYSKKNRKNKIFIKNIQDKKINF